jgi:hypothetical protein
VGEVEEFLTSNVLRQILVVILLKVGWKKDKFLGNEESNILERRGKIRAEDSLISL